ncbi:long-chain fatty acid--CoA ligase [Lentzea sp. BCCO 10_0856]|uniref:Acyl-CoA synthetase n=1 Tax=Lentzea miocenica TaxID=3095431 RepID=A0ABU4T895_9PSEU|nr:long-chain fatty acid--CoA ligase [Lentzea sp. BCCO 10_0856]MDX8034330.1 long-chain fatty acid--CoA ligase [Lentzea sp. BCCO 10_0856]
MTTPETTTAGTTTPKMITTVVTRVKNRAADTPDQIALRAKDFGIWQEVSWACYWANVELVGDALLALGLQPGDRVAIHSENRREWLYADLGIVAARGITVGLYPTNPASEVAYLLSHSGARILIAEDQEQVDKALLVLEDTPDLEWIVYLEPRGIKGRYDNPKLMAWDDFLALGARHRDQHGDELAERMARTEQDDVMTLIYTSGTTGPPKGAMLTVANVEFAVHVLVEGGGFTSPPPSSTDVTLSYLPLCHVAERIFTTWFSAASGVQVHFAESIETVQANLREVQPTILFGVPRIWEKVLAGVTIGVSSASWLKRSVTRFWLRRAEGIGETLVHTGGKHTGKSRLIYALGWLFCFRALKARIGMRYVRYAASGAAPIAPDVLKFFMGIGVPMHEVYGMTENTAVATGNRPGRVKIGTVGEPQPGIELRIDEETGEILTKHGGTFAGYWQDPESTRRVLSDGWLHTGDVGEWVDETHVKITDRMKDIIITAGGKNIAPSELENALKTSPYIKEAVVIGDQRAYLVALIGIELDTVGHWAQQRKITYTTYRDLSEKPEVLELVQQIVTEVNGKFATVEQIKKFRMFPKELDHEDGELTATQKVKRSALGKMFDDLVESMYG